MARKTIRKILSIYIRGLFICTSKKRFNKWKSSDICNAWNKQRRKKDVLGIWINENESATFWTEVFEEIKERGVEEILFISLDGLSGLSEALLKVLYLRIKDLEKSWSKGTKNWENVKHQLIELYGERVLKYYFNT